MKNSIPISSLLHHKSPALWSIAPDATVFEAIRLMADKNIGALLVLSDGKLVGLFTERDYARKIALQRHARNVADRVRELAGKAYWSQFSTSPEFVIAPARAKTFVPLLFSEPNEAYHAGPRVRMIGMFA